MAPAPKIKIRMILANSITAPREAVWRAVFGIAGIALYGRRGYTVQVNSDFAGLREGHPMAAGRGNQITVAEGPGGNALASRYRLEI